MSEHSIVAAFVAPGEDRLNGRPSIAQRIAAKIDPERFGVRAVYVCENIQNSAPRPGGDVDLVIHLETAHSGRRELEAWLEGWSLCLAEIHNLRSGDRSTGLRVLFVTDDLRVPLSGEIKTDGPSHYRERPGLYDG